MSTEDIKKRFQSIQSAYRFHFAGHPRASRNVAQLQKILADLEALLSQPSADSNLNEQMQKARDAYRGELPKILTAKAGPKALEVARAIGWLQLNFGRYRRGFAGKSRDTRNPHRLQQILENLRKRRAHLETFALIDRHNSELSGALRNADQQCQMYEKEVGLIESALERGEAIDKVKRYVDLEGRQWTTYQESFAAKSRGSRNLATLSRMCDTTRDMLARTEPLHKNDAKHTSHLRAMKEHAQLYEKELSEVQNTQGDLSPERRMGELGAAANQCFEAYRSEFSGTPRSAVDPDRLDRILEDLFGFAQQMERLKLPSGSDEATQNERNFQIVLDRMRVYDREHQQIVKAQATPVH